jgi:hypothetical protein
MKMLRCAQGFPFPVLENRYYLFLSNFTWKFVRETGSVILKKGVGLIITETIQPSYINFLLQAH